MTKKKPIENWIFLAEGDLKIAKDELNMPAPFTIAICFHSQQCVEKYLKAYLLLVGKPFGKTHDIALLIELCNEEDEEFVNLYNIHANKLTRYAVEIRYPDDFYLPSIEEAKEFVINKLKEKGFSV